MNRLLTLELNKQDESIEIHLNERGAEYLKSILDNLISHKQDEHIHLMTPNWGGKELSNDQQNLNDNIELLHHLKIMYWKD